MAPRSDGNTRASRQGDYRLKKITVAGYKSLRGQQTVDVGALTILAGANSSGKSSIIQPLLLLKQTVEADYDPGALRLNGPNVRFSKAEQLLSRSDQGEPVGSFRIGTEFGPRFSVNIAFRRLRGGGFNVSRICVVAKGDKFELTPRMGHAAIRDHLPGFVRDPIERLAAQSEAEARYRVIRQRCFLTPIARIGGNDGRIVVPSIAMLEQCLRNFIHVPALRGNPQRTYPVTAVGPTFTGNFDSYVASVIAQWQADKNRNRLKGLNDDLKLLDLTRQVVAKRISDAEVELYVARLPRAVRGRPDDLVSIADVGFGVSQAVPVLVALHVATPQHLVYLEEPEIHLHPRAQVAMARVLTKAVKRGVRIVVETHSPLLLLAIQTLVAQGELSPDLVKLHWFTRSKTTGVTKIRSADLDDAGAFGDWPEDFGSVEAEIENRYLSAAEAKLLKK